MSLKKKLTSIVLAGTLLLGSAGCKKDSPQYQSNKKIDESLITVTESKYATSSEDNLLITPDTNDPLRRYINSLEEKNLKLESLEIMNDKQTTNYKMEFKVMK
jgi:hypothetical protein